MRSTVVPPSDKDELRRRLSATEAEALRVGDSPIRADRLAEELEELEGMAAGLTAAAVGEEALARLTAHLSDAVRVLRRDDDGREAARHLVAAGRLLGQAPRKPSPFLDD